ncbi:unnamed protein product [Triticum turgidum subsp. durum]|uniref:F-box domain-containing protein n=1 Tax=Triticum turgidum subsp. durum TaxID=4567 RepID=A0A9R0RXK4_TRITD|nr:unnamed protein product [Triticum turgidum subsp. durum]
MSTRGEMSPPLRRTPPPPASLPDDDDLLREILLRLPPRPSSLPRASLVCKRWRSLIGDPRFQRRFRGHHGKPPLLGFFLDEYSSCPFVPLLDRPDRIPGDRFFKPLHDGNRIVDCRHGLVLIFSSRQNTWAHGRRATYWCGIPSPASSAASSSHQSWTLTRCSSSTGRCFALPAVTAISRWPW